MKKNKRNSSNLLQKLKPNLQSKRRKLEENSKGFEWLYTRSWAKGLGRRHGMMGAWCGASSSLDLVAQVCQPPALRPRRRHLDGRWKRTVIDVRRRRVDDPDERCPPVAHRLSRLGHDEFREPATRNAVELGRASASRRWPASGVDGGVPWRQSSGVATLYQECIRRCRLTVERGWGWMAESRLEDF